MYDILNIYVGANEWLRYLDVVKFGPKIMSYCHNNLAVFNPQFLSVYFWHGRQLKNFLLIILRSNNGMKSNIC